MKNFCDPGSGCISVAATRANFFIFDSVCGFGVCPNSGRAVSALGILTCMQMPVTALRGCNDTVHRTRESAQKADWEKNQTCTSVALVFTVQHLTSEARVHSWERMLY